MKKTTAGVIFLALLLVSGAILMGCTAGNENGQANGADTNNAPDDNQIVGGDADEHGCIGSAGYTWCEEKQECLRTWEEACIEDTNAPSNDDNSSIGSSDKNILINIDDIVVNEPEEEEMIESTDNVPDEPSV